MEMQDLVNKYAHCDVYHYDENEYKELDSLSYDEYDELNAALNRLGYNITYNNLDECYCIH